jgi:geranylgeranyl diphosphate synthase type II
MTSHSSAELEERMREVRRSVDQRLPELVPDENAPPEKLHRAMRYSLLAPGKRIRPVITILAAEAFGAPGELALDPACAVEMVHAASLILDDLPSMDDASLRRGQPTNHLVFGQDIATLASVSLLNRAYLVLANSPGLGLEVRIDLVDLLARMIGDDGIVSGQVHDLHFTGRADSELSELERMAGQKTSALFVAGAEMGARVAGVSSEWIEAVGAFAWDLGLCFQVLDDLADLQETPESTGKNVGQDASKTTFVSVLGTERAREAAEMFARAAVGALDLIGPGAERLAQLADYLLDRARRLSPQP